MFMSLEALICDTEAQMQMCVDTYISDSQKLSEVPTLEAKKSTHTPPATDK